MLFAIYLPLLALKYLQNVLHSAFMKTDVYYIQIGSSTLGFRVRRDSNLQWEIGSGRSSNLRWVIRFGRGSNLRWVMGCGRGSNLRWVISFG